MDKMHLVSYKHAGNNLKVQCIAMADIVNAELSDAIRSSLNQVLAKELGSAKIDVNIESGSMKGDNFVGIVYRVNGKLSTKNLSGNAGNTKTSINLILKAAPTNKARRETFLSRIFFLREIKMYDEVLPMFHRFQESNGIIPEENGFHEYPKCYKTIDTEIDETLILEDLKVDQFEMFDRFQLITIDHVRLIMKTLGKYHALSFALRDKQPECLKCYSEMSEVLSRPLDDNMKAYFKHVTDNVYKSLDQGGDERLLEKVTELFKRDHNTLMEECVKGESAEPYAVICHGDCWNNNLMFRYDENKQPIDLRLLDWQISRYATPVTDLVYYIFCCTTKPLRNYHYDEMIQTYHDSLSEMLIRMGSNPAKLFPFDALQDQLQQFGKFGLVMSSLVLPIVTSMAENIPDLDELADKFQDEASIENSIFMPEAAVFNKRMRDVIIDMDRLGYF